MALSDRELLEHISRKQDEQIIEVKELKKSHYELRETVTEMDHTIRGTKAERESGKGGMAKQVQQNTICIKEIKRKQYKIFTWGGVLVTVFNLAIIAIKELIKS